MWLVYILLSIVFVIVCLVLGLQLYMKYLLQKEIASAQSSEHLQSDPLLASLDPKRVALVYFTADWCAPCRTMQSPIIETIKQEMPELQIITVDIDKEPDIKARWQVMGLPRTFVIGQNHQICATNIDVVNKVTLKTQLEDALKGKIDKIQVRQHTKRGISLPKFSVKH